MKKDVIINTLQNNAFYRINKHGNIAFIPKLGATSAYPIAYRKFCSLINTDYNSYKEIYEHFYKRIINNAEKIQDYDSLLNVIRHSFDIEFEGNFSIVRPTFLKRSASSLNQEMGIIARNIIDNVATSETLSPSASIKLKAAFQRFKRLCILDDLYQNPNTELNIGIDRTKNPLNFIFQDEQQR